MLSVYLFIITATVLRPFVLLVKRTSNDHDHDDDEDNIINVLWINGWIIHNTMIRAYYYVHDNDIPPTTTMMNTVRYAKKMGVKDIGIILLYDDGTDDEEDSLLLLLRYSGIIMHYIVLEQAADR